MNFGRPLKIFVTVARLMRMTRVAELLRSLKPCAGTGCVTPSGGAFGCGAFGNPAAAVAHLYREAIAARARDFEFIAFAIYSAGYGPDNYPPFVSELSEVVNC